VDQSAKLALPRSGATLPEAANSSSRVQHGDGTTRRVKNQPTPIKAGTSVKAEYLEVFVVAGEAVVA
jgi:hypothetical protein